MPGKPDILVLFAHLAIGRSRINRAMLEAIRDLDRVVVHDLLETYPDFYIDVAAEQSRLRDIDLLVIQHPVYWYGVPAIIKHWLDTVLTRGFAYGADGGALRDKALLQVCSTGAPASAYQPGGQHGLPVSDLFIPLTSAARFCGMTWLPPLVLHGGHGLPDEVIGAHAQAYRDRLATYAHDAVRPPAKD